MRPYPHTATQVQEEFVLRGLEREVEDGVIDASAVRKCPAASRRIPLTARPAAKTRYLHNQGICYAYRRIASHRIAPAAPTAAPTTAALTMLPSPSSLLLLSRLCY